MNIPMFMFFLDMLLLLLALSMSPRGRLSPTPTIPPMADILILSTMAITTVALIITNIMDIPIGNFLLKPYFYRVDRKLCYNFIKYSITYTWEHK